MNIANDIRELERKAKFFRKVERAWIFETEDVCAGEANSSGNAMAIFAKAVKRRIGLDREIHLGAGDEVVEIAGGHVVALNCVHKRGESFGGVPGIRIGALERCVAVY